MRSVHNVRHTEIQLSLALLRMRLATKKMKSYKSPGTDQIPSEQIQTGGETFTFSYLQTYRFCLV